MGLNPEARAHQEWLGYLQPVGLVVSPPALLAAQAHPNRDALGLQRCLLDLLGESGDGREGERVPSLDDFPGFTREFLGWERADLAGAPGAPALPDSLEVVLPEYGDRLRPTYAVPRPDDEEDADPGDPHARWLMLIEVLPRTVADLDELPEGEGRAGHGWRASPQARFERLLRETQVPVGLLCNGTHLRLVFAPRGESSGHLTFPMSALQQVAGRPLVAALHMLLGSERLFSVPPKERLAAILHASRKYQNDVSTRLAGQVLDALYELLRGFEAADEAARGELLGELRARAPQEIYGGLLGTLLRLVFILYAEDRGLLPGDPVYQEHYSLGRLFERLRDDAARYPDTMDQRYGAWAQLLTLFRLVHDGASHRALHLPERRGRLFDPDTWDFLEGRPFGDVLDRTRRLRPPRVSDGVVWRVLERLMMLQGERISYRALDVEQIGSVYEAMMGFELRVAEGRSISVRPDDVVVDLDALLARAPGERLKALAEQSGCKPTGAAAEAFKAATTPEEAASALGRQVSRRTPRLIPRGGLFLQPTEERRRSGSHYTPRALTEPIVRATLRPLLERLGPRVRPEDVLALKVCDPAMGSGAFLVEACRFLAERLVDAWQAHGAAPLVPPDEDLVTHARRLVASRALYGVDKNPFAVDLAKLSLWLATLARDQPFTFLDHALRCGDSLVGLGRRQIESFDWAARGQGILAVSSFLKDQLALAEQRRASLHGLGDAGDNLEKPRLHREAQRALEEMQRCAHVVVAAFFARSKDKDREALRLVYADRLRLMLEERASSAELDDIAGELRRGPHGLEPFHWEIEFPEVFSRERPGFDAFVGNPPFAGKNTLGAGTRAGYADWLKQAHAESHGNADLVAHFFRRAFDLLRQGGTFGLIATNTIAQGDTRGTGLRFLCTHGGTIYAATRRVKWPGRAAVVVSVVHVAKGHEPRPFVLDGREVPRITAFLFHDGGHDDPVRLEANAGKSFQGSIVLGMGFTFDDDNPDATPLAEMRRLIEKDPRNAERIFPYIGGEEVNDSPTHAHRRYVINFGEMSEEEARRWPDLMAIVEAKVKPERMTKDPRKYPRMVHEWWKYWNARPELNAAIAGLDRVLICARHQQHWTLACLPASAVFSDALVVFVPGRAGAATMQSRIHGVWARFFGSSMKDDLRYTPSDCFETFPFPPGWETDARLEAAGRAYYNFRAALMVRNDEGLTKTYNRFHDQGERDADILRLRELHDDLDRAVLDAYGWTDLRPRCEFLLDYEDDDEADDDARPTRRKKPWRWRWPDDVRDAVLARLLALNAERAAEEARAGATAAPKAKPRPKKRTPPASTAPKQLLGD